MVTVAVIAILAIVAIPNLRDFVHNNRLRAASNELTAALQAARMEAIRLNSRALVCRSADGATCAGSNGNWTGWVVLADLDKDGAADDRVRSGTLNPAVQVSTSVAIENGTITFFPDGLARGANTLPLDASIGACIQPSGLAQNRRIVRLSTGGRLRVVTDSSSSCAAPSNT
jgi:type IV fimbrial biogenesis protein FimT